MKQGWEYKKFEACINKTPKPKQVKTEEYNSGTKYPIVSQEDKLISGYYDDESYVFHIDSPVVIFGDHTRVLKYVDFDFVVGADGVKIISPKQELNAKFLLYYLQWYKIPNLGYSRHYKLLKELNIPLPPKSTQLAIVSELDKINELIRLKKEQLKDFDNLAQSIFYEMFGDPVENEMGWEVKKLGEVSSSKGGGTPSKSKPEYWNGNIAWVSSKDMKSMYISDTQLHITDLGMQNSPAKLLPIGTILIVNRSGILKHTLPIAITTKAVTINQDIKALLVNDKIANALFVLYTLKMSSSYLLSKTKAVTVDSINFAEFKALKIPLPPLPLQHLFAHRIEQIEHQKAEVQKAIIDLETLLASRMQYWFE